MVSIIRTSKGPLNFSAFCRTSVKTDQGQSVGIAFHMMDGGTLTLPLPEGDRLARWIEERAVFDSTITAPAARLDSDLMRQYDAESNGD